MGSEKNPISAAAAHSTATALSRCECVCQENENENENSFILCGFVVKQARNLCAEQHIRMCREYCHLSAS